MFLFLFSPVNWKWYTPVTSRVVKVLLDHSSFANVNLLFSERNDIGSLYFDSLLNVKVDRARFHLQLQFIPMTEKRNIINKFIFWHFFKSYPGYFPSNFEFCNSQLESLGYLICCLIYCWPGKSHSIYGQAFPTRCN